MLEDDKILPSKKLVKGEDYYINEHGNWIFTAAYHLKRGYCCNSGCKHCPYGYHKKQKRFTVDRKKIVIVGGGFAGIQFIEHLDQDLFEVLLIDKLNHHQFQPLFYQVATSKFSLIGS